ncbi:MAG TPA: response regulator transcription factor [Gammaproteobacteria bacterium]|jgi:two-component system KDP operon response regulator KdpE
MTEREQACRDAVKILAIEDEAQIRRFLQISLEAHGFRFIGARLGEDGLSRCVEEQPDLVILDLGLPDISGYEAIKRLREWSEIPIIVLSVHSDESEKVKALDLGANDYVTKPFGISELMARIRVLLRSGQKDSIDETGFRCGDLEVDFIGRSVQVAGKEVHLSKKEYALLKLLVTHPGQMLTHEHILREIWGPEHQSDTHYLRVLMGHLRQKLGDEPMRPRYIRTVQGVGYRLIVDA